MIALYLAAASMSQEAASRVEGQLAVSAEPMRPAPVQATGVQATGSLAPGPGSRNASGPASVVLPGARPPHPAKARANLASYITDDDYPADAIRDRIEGRVGFRLEITPEGHASRCQVVEPSGSASLDAATCRVMIERARFEPARDDHGTPVADSAVFHIGWLLQ